MHHGSMLSPSYGAAETQTSSETQVRRERREAHLMRCGASSVARVHVDPSVHPRACPKRARTARPSTFGVPRAFVYVYIYIYMCMYIYIYIYYIYIIYIFVCVFTHIRITRLRRPSASRSSASAPRARSFRRRPRPGTRCCYYHYR